MPANSHVPDGNVYTMSFADDMPASPAASSSFISHLVSIFPRTNHGKTHFATALLCASLLCPSFAFADLTITKATLNNQRNGVVVEPSLLMNPGTNWAGYRPLFRLTVVAKADKVNGEYRFWYYTRLIFKNLDTGSQHINFCTKSTPMQVNYDSTLESRNFNLFDRFSPEDRRNFELLVPGEYQLIIEAYNQARQCDRWLWSISPRTTVDGILRILPFQAISAVSINGGSKLGLHPGDKFDLNFTVENNRASNQEAGGSASIGRVEWLIASSRPASTNTNIAAGMNCATPNPVSGNFSGRYSSKLLDVISVPQDADFGIYNLYLRVHDRNSSATCSTDGAITPLYIMHGAISVEPAVRSIKISPALPQPQPPIAVGMHDITMNWEVKFSNSVTGVDAKHFRLVSTGFALAPALTSLSGSGNLYHVTTVVPAGSITPDKQASLRLDFIDDDSVRTVPSERPIGGPGIGNGNFTGETYALMGTICGAANTIWCDDFERTVQGESGPGAISRSGMVGNGWTVESAHSACTSQMPSNNAQPDAGGCAGIDSDIKPYREYGASLRANRGRSMFNRWQQHSVTSKQIDLSGLPANSAVELAYWLRRGDDSFASVPQSKHAHIHAEYLDKTGTWQTLAYHRSATSRGTPGEILRPIFQLPEDALWQGFRLRFTQPEGRGFGDNSDPKRVNGYDYWFIDDVSLRRVDAPRYAGGFCDNFEAPTASLKQWSFNNEDAATGTKPGGLRIGEAGVTGDIYPTDGSKSHSMFLRWSYAAATTLRIDTRGLDNPIRYVMQRGMKNAPNKINGAPVVTSCDQTVADKGNRFASEYWGSDKSWHVLQDVDGVDSGHCGETFDFVSPPLSSLPFAQHENFRLRFRQISMGPFQDNPADNYDYWLVDDVCVGRKAAESYPVADLELSKRREGPLLAGKITTYVLRVKNNGPDRVRGSLQIVDTLPAELSFHTFRGQGWACRAEEKKITCSWSGDLKSGETAPDLRLYAIVSEAAKDRLTNRASVSTGAAIDPVESNNTAVDESRFGLTRFAFTKGACKNGQTIEAAGSSNACSHYKFDGLAGEQKKNIYLTQMDDTGKLAQDSPSGASMSLEFALRCIDPPGPPAQGAVYAAFGGKTLLPLSICSRSDETTQHWNTTTPLSLMIMPGEATANGVFSFFYEDVGGLELFVRIAGENDKTHSSGAFVQKPAALALKNVTCADGTANPAAQASSDARFCKSGQTFEMAVESHSVQGNITPNFGNENTGKAIFLEKALLMPSNGDDPDLAVQGLLTITNGAARITNQSWQEVGIITIAPRLGDKASGAVTLSDDYLGAGDIPPAGRQPVNVGRFYPDHFQTGIGPLGRMTCPPGLSCPPGGFFYTGQPFELKLKACMYGDKACSARLDNYRNDFAAQVKLSAWAARGSTANADENPPDPATNGGRLEPMPGHDLSAAEIPSSKFVDAYGAGGMFSGLFRYVYTLKSRPVEPVNIYIRATEDGRDGVTSLSSAAAADSPEAGIKVARGRIRLINHFGTGKTKLEIPIQIQFWHCDGSSCAWVLSATDLSQIGPNTPLADADKRAALSVSLHQSPGSAPMASPPQVEDLNLSGGIGQIILKPGGSTGSVGVSINLGGSAEDNACDHAAAYKEGAASNLSWLRAWNGTCNQAQSGEADPAARATFGIYSGESYRAVHKREVF